MIADRPLAEIVPLQLAEDRAAPAERGANGKPERSYKIVTQYSMGPIEEIGLLKMDFLGLRNLDVIEDAVEIIERSRGAQIDIEAMPLDDPKTYEMLSAGDSVGVFQLESDGMRDALRRVRPTDFDDIVALVALYRPGAMRFIDDYASGKRDPTSVRYADPRLRPIAESTYGCCIYQEQLMEIAKQMAGFSPAQADDLRKAVGKKKRDLMAQMKDKFLAGLAESGTDRRVAQDLWSLMTAAADYSFNRSSRRLLRADRLPDGLPEGQLPGRVHGGGDLLGDVDEGQGAVLRQPLRGDGDRGAAARRQLLRPRLRGQRQVDPVRARRRQERRPCGGPGDHRRARARRAVLLDLGLLRAGRRASREQASDRVPGQVRGARLDRRQPQGDARGPRRGPGERLEVPGGRPPRPGLDLRPRRRARRGPRAEARRRAGSHRPPVPAEEFDQRELLRLEKETLGTFLSAHPLGEVRDALRERVDCSLAEVGGKEDGAWVTVGGIVSECKRVRTRSGAYVMFATLDDLEGRVELFVRDAASEAAERIELDRVILVRGRVDHKGRGEMSLVVAEAEPFEPGEDEVAAARAKAKAREPERILLRVSAAEFGPQLVDELKSVFQASPASARSCSRWRPARGLGGCASVASTA